MLTKSYKTVDTSSYFNKLQNETEKLQNETEKLAFNIINKSYKLDNKEVSFDILFNIFQNIGNDKQKINYVTYNCDINNLSSIELIDLFNTIADAEYKIIFLKIIGIIQKLGKNEIHTVYQYFINQYNYDNLIDLCKIDGFSEKLSSDSISKIHKSITDYEIKFNFLNISGVINVLEEREIMEIYKDIWLSHKITFLKTHGVIDKLGNKNIKHIYENLSDKGEFLNIEGVKEKLYR